MCLVIKSRQEPMIAPTDIECYKIVNLYEDGTYHSHFKTDFVWEFGKTMDSKLHVDIVSHSHVNEGFHSYQTLKDAKIALSQAIVRFAKVALAKCIIPKGSLYFDGKINDIHFGTAGYTSDKIKMVEVVELKDKLSISEDFPFKVEDEVTLEMSPCAENGKVVAVYHPNKEYYQLHVKLQKSGVRIVWTNNKGKSILSCYPSIKKARNTRTIYER